MPRALAVLVILATAALVGSATSATSAASAGGPSAASAGGPSAASGGGPRTGPKGVAFYRPPKHLRGRHGSLIWARRQSGPDALNRGARLLLYRSTGVDGGPNAVSASLTLPKGRPPNGGWPVISYAHGTTGSADACAPSRGYDFGRITSYAYPLLRRWLKAGYAVVRTDYDGLGTPGVHGYLIGATEGRSVLDAVRAARTLEPRLSRRFAIAGHSQGGHAALFAASLARSRVPELRLRGTVAFAPASHLAAQFPLATQIAAPAGGLGGIIALGLRSVATAAPSVGVAGLLTPQAAQLFPQTLSKCYHHLARADSFGGLPLNQIFRTGADLSALVAVIAANDPEHLRPRTPVRIEQGEVDGTVFKTFTDQLVDAYEANGVPVSYRVYEDVDHVRVVAAGAADATRWIGRRLR
jgi:acetyl esterase/lipase